MTKLELPSVTRFEDDPTSDVLWVIFLPEDPQDGQSKTFNAMQSVVGKKLYFFMEDSAFWLIRDPQSHRDRVDMVMKTIGDVGRHHAIGRKYAFGFSRGANAVLVAGCMMKFDRIVAMSPELKIGLPNSLSAHLKPDPQYGDMIPLINSFDGQAIDLILPCFSSHEGLNFSSAELIQNSKCIVHHVATDHRVLPRLHKTGQFPAFIQQIEQGQALRLTQDWHASDAELQVTKAAFELLSRLSRGERQCPEVDDSNSKNHEWFFLKAKALMLRGDFSEALIASEKAVELHSPVPAHMILLGKLYLRNRDLTKAKEICRRATVFARRSGNAHHSIKRLELLIAHEERKIVKLRRETAALKKHQDEVTT